MVSNLSERKENARKYYEILVNRFGSSEEAKMIKEKSALRDSLRVGKPVPAFSFVSMDDSARTMTNESLKGKYYLISFWAAKSEASLREMKGLQETYERYKGDHFAILSLSLDESREDVVEFRKGSWKMPWMNVFLGQDINNKAVKDFNAFDIPLTLLVDPKGNLVVMGKKLSDENLRFALEQYLGK